MEQVMELLLATEEKMDSHHEELMAEMKISHKMMAIMKASFEEMEAAVETNQEEVNAMDLESNPEEKVVMVEHQEVPKRPWWKLLEHWRTDMGTDTKAMVGPGRSWLPPADG
jgi:hypothetical protein